MNGCNAILIPGKLDRAAKRFKLTPRERQTLALLSEGLPWKGVAERLCVTIRTVQFHVANICKKTGCGNSLAALGKLFLN